MLGTHSTGMSRTWTRPGERLGHTHHTVRLSVALV